MNESHWEWWADMKAKSVERWFHASDGIFAGRLNDGRVILVRSGVNPADGPSLPTLLVVFDDGIWGSLVLTMSAFNERPNDWQEFMDHHHGRRDLMEPAKSARLKGQ